MVKITLTQHGFPSDRTEIAGTLFKRGEMQELDIKDSWMMIGTSYLDIEVDRKEIDSLNDRQLMVLGRVFGLEDIDEIKNKMAPKRPTVASKVKETISKVLPSTPKNDESTSSEESEESSELE